ncbi:Si-specific NAD(P)(+) transhydrogenase [Parvularcula sp. IMCC14364]|uniref:Si-specific NAD(P)(+) transhydrogenase n=1 Tax=Parvularcula sp. IMCC14364 TaxID=3067902 RepID=UPI0027415AB2|nr:Si-specific NAD(P)(+) transhydrogenase [Parvularcula sp. IMCC14364]
MAERYNLIVIGSGPAGRRAAIQAAKLGKSVLIIEKGRRVGGVSVHTGTIPSKTLRETVLNLSGWRERGFYGQNYKVKANISADDLKKRLLATLDHEVEVLEHQFCRNRVERVQGTARFLSRHKVEVIGASGEKTLYSFDNILICVGTKPFRPENIPFDGTHIIDSDEVLDLETLPKSIVVVGAGVIGVEYATIFSTLDIRVSLIEPRDTVLDFVDRELIADFLYDLRDRGIQLRLGSKAEKIERRGNGCRTTLDNGRVMDSDMVLFAAGRLGATKELNLDACGLETDHRGRLSVDRHSFETDVPGIYAAGDVIGFPSLASTSMEQGRIACCHAFDVTIEDVPEHFPYGIYAVPEISMIGMTEEQIREKGIAYECGVARFRETSRGHILGINRGMMKMLFSLEDRRLLGVHIIGEGATELIHIGQAAMTLGGTVDYFVNSIFNYPTLAEAYKIAALDAWNRMHHGVSEEQAGNTEEQPEAETDGQLVA